MELSKKTTILFPPDLHEQLSRLAAKRGTSLGELVRTACAREYGLVSREARVKAVHELASLGLPVDEPEVMERESVAASCELLP